MKADIWTSRVPGLAPSFGTDERLWGLVLEWFLWSYFLHNLLGINNSNAFIFVGDWGL